MHQTTNHMAKQENRDIKQKKICIKIRNLENPLYIVYFTQFKISMKRPYTTYGGIYDRISSLQEAFH